MSFNVLPLLSLGLVLQYVSPAPSHFCPRFIDSTPVSPISSFPFPLLEADTKLSLP